MAFALSDIISINDFSKKDVLSVLEAAKRMEKASAAKKAGILKNKTVASLFFEPSTRTRLSFEAAIQNLGGRIIGFADVGATSIKKRETMSDTIRMADGYADIIVMRHHVNGSARRAAEIAKAPVVNGGDGTNQHPTQTLLDLYTIQKAFGKLSGLTVGFLGDLKYGRTVRCLAQALSMFNTKKMFMIAPASLKLQAQYVEALSQSTKVIETDKLEKALPGLDLLYSTRIQEERFPDPAEYEKMRGVYVLNKKILKKTKPGFRIMHPLPRVDEISSDLDDTDAALYFEQAANGVPVREALLSLLIGKKGKKKKMW